MFTSGTTDVSKRCLLSHCYAFRTAENMIGPFRIPADDVAYTPYPLPHGRAIRVRGEMVSGFEFEEGALSHQGIEDAAAIGVPAALGLSLIHI